MILIRDVAYIWNAWKSGDYVGDRKFVTRVTVETSFQLRTAPDGGAVLGPWTRGPARWYQRDLPGGAHSIEGDSPQKETEIPGVVSYHHSRSVDQDAGSMDFTVINTAMPPFGAPESLPGQFGDHGHLSWDHGGSQDALARWGHVINEWHNILVPNALIRSYQGFGGDDKTLEQALADGNLVLNGVWMIDEVDISTDGTIAVRCRDQGNLLVDQQLFPPLVPRWLYPLEYKRYEEEAYKISPDPPPSVTEEAINQPTDYGANGPAPHSSTDATYGGFDTTATGHPPSLVTDWSTDAPNSGPGQIGHQRTYWLSEPKSGPNDHVWIELGTGVTDVNIIYFHPWAGMYLVYVSIFENGGWVVPEVGGQGGIGPDGVPYVMTFTSNWEGGQPPGVATNQYELPRTYRSERMRLTITNLVAAPEGGFRAGARKIIAQLQQSHVEWPRYSFAAAGYPSNTVNKAGYWQVRSDGRLFAFGDARLQSPNSPFTTHQQPVVAMNANSAGTGYWTMDYSGRVISYGSASWYGDAEDYRKHDAMDFAVAPNGTGYWILHRDGVIHAFGSAAVHGNSVHTGTLPSGAVAVARSIESHPTTSGYWVLWTDGHVDAHVLTHHGNANRNGYTPTEYVAAIRRTRNGGGYWIPSGGGIVQAFGNATWIANAPRYADEQWAAGGVWDMIGYSLNDKGYAVQHADGNLNFFGDFEAFGSFGTLSGTLRRDGNYIDYSDIVRELLLWSGFYLYRDPPSDTQMPEIYGNIETTGSFSRDPLPKENFDKRPVIDAIRWLKGLVGYVFFIDCEGAARWESPNWWAMGNYLLDGTPFGYMPEIDETVQLLSHSIKFSATNARSEIIIANEEPAPTTGWRVIPKGVITTIVHPQWAFDDLKGKIVPAMWTNSHFTEFEEQQIMADLISMQMWFSRRQANVSCVANPLIDINDQVRIIERQTGETYVHYVRGVDITHDVLSGDATMSLTTHWLGGSPYGQSTLYFATDGTPLGDGYWQVTAHGAVFAYGNARLYPPNDDDSHTEWVKSLRTTPSGDGYYTCDISGKVVTYGDAEQHGHLFRTINDVTDMAITPSGHGYWLLTWSGEVFGFGDAVNYGNATVTGTMPSGDAVRAESIEAHPTNGYWILTSDGDVQVFGAATHEGNADRVGFTPTEHVNCLRRTNSGNGYWIVSGSGIVQNFGDAPHLGDAEKWTENFAAGLIWSMVHDDFDQYALLRANGTLLLFGSFANVGDSQFAQGQAVDWALMPAEAYAAAGQPADVMPITPELMRFLQRTGSPSANNAVAANFGYGDEATIKAVT